MYHYKYEEFIQDLEFFYKLLKDYKPDIILAVARGGVTFGHFMAERLNLRELYTLNSVHYDNKEKLDIIKISNIPNIPANKRVLVLDDIVDSGESMGEIMRVFEQKFPKTSFKTGAIFYKKDAIFTPDFKIKEAHDWIEFFWSNPKFY